MGQLDPGDIVQYQKEPHLPIFSTLEERTKEASWGDTQKIHILDQ